MVRSSTASSHSRVRERVEAEVLVVLGEGRELERGEPLAEAALEREARLGAEVDADLGDEQIAQEPILFGLERDVAAGRRASSFARATPALVRRRHERLRQRGADLRIALADEARAEERLRAAAARLAEQLAGEPAHVGVGVIEAHAEARERARVGPAADLGERELHDLDVGVIERGEEPVLARGAPSACRPPTPRPRRTRSPAARS